VRSLFFAVLGYFLTPAGVVAMGILDASIVFFLPLGIDFVVIIMTARKPELFWLYALLATIGSVGGAAGTYWIGAEAGEHGLTRFVSQKKLRGIKTRVNNGAIVVASLAIIPPPFPFTPFVLTGGALGMNVWAFFTTLAGARIVRFGIEASLASVYGAQILKWMKTPTFEAVVAGIAVLAVVGTIVSAVALLRGGRTKR
jgi:membrane protein YqaA with SNARE-associated domain